MSAGNGSLNGSVPDYVTRAEFEDLEERLHVGLHRANAGIQRIESLLKRQATTLSEHSIALAEMGSAIMRIETRLSTHDKVIEAHDRAIDDVEDKADRASKPDETLQGFAQVALERDRAALEAERERKALEAERARESIRAKADVRKARIAIAMKFAAAVTGSAVVGLVIAALAKSCGVDLPTP